MIALNWRWFISLFIMNEWMINCINCHKILSQFLRFIAAYGFLARLERHVWKALDLGNHQNERKTFHDTFKSNNWHLDLMLMMVVMRKRWRWWWRVSCHNVRAVQFFILLCWNFMFVLFRICFMILCTLVYDTRELEVKRTTSSLTSSSNPWYWGQSR